jgi:hypothetical protein
MILSKVRDPRLVTIRRGGTLTDSDHHLLALWAAECARACPSLFRVGSTAGPAAASSDRACLRLGARRGQDDASARRRRPRNGSGQGFAWGTAVCRLRCRPGRSRRACQSTVTWRARWSVCKPAGRSCSSRHRCPFHQTVGVPAPPSYLPGSSDRLIRRQNRLGSANLPTNHRRIRWTHPMIDPSHRTTRPSPSH